MRTSTLSITAIVLVALTAQLCLGGWSSKKIRGSGDITTETRDVEEIEGVELATIGKLFIEVGDKESLEIEAEDNLIEYIETEVHGGILVIETSDRIELRPREAIKYYLTVRQLEEVRTSSSGDIEVSDLKADRFRVTIGSSGDIEMGDLNATSLDIRVRSSGDVSLENVTAKKADVDIQSSGDVSIGDLRSQLLVVDISSSGNVSVGGGNVKEQDIEINSSGDYKARNLESEEASVAVNSSGDATLQVSEFLDARASSSGDIHYIGDPELRQRTTSSGDIRRIR